MVLIRTCLDGLSLKIDIKFALFHKKWKSVSGTSDNTERRLRYRGLPAGPDSRFPCSQQNFHCVALFPKGFFFFF